MNAFLKIILLPFSFLYYIIIFFRNFFYNNKIFKSYTVQKQVISVGNISTGGTGKSPFTIYLAEYFLKHGLKPAIVSRGYRRESDNIETVYDGNKITGTIAGCGDEPMMMAERLSEDYNNFYIAAGSDRVKTSEYVIDRFNPDLIILDDAFQHRRIKRNLDIVLIDATEFNNNKIFNSIVLPAGNLRENLRNLKRADIIIGNYKFSSSYNPDFFVKYGKENFIFNYKIKGFFDYNNTEYNLEGKDVTAFCGIASPGSFFSRIDSCKCNSVKKITFKDHHKYSKDDIELLMGNSGKKSIFITTEKDFVKIRKFEDFLKYFSVLFMKIELNLNDEKRFFSLMDKFLLKSNK